MANSGCGGRKGRRAWQALARNSQSYLKPEHDFPPVCQQSSLLTGLRILPAPRSKNSNTSQFYITLAPAPACDGKHVVIGRVVSRCRRRCGAWPPTFHTAFLRPAITTPQVEGLEVLARVDAEAASEGGEPRAEVVVADCGVL